MILKKEYVLSMGMILGSLFLHAEDQNRSIAFSAFDFGLQQKLSPKDEFEARGHLQSNYMPETNSGFMPLALLLYLNSPEYQQARLEFQEQKALQAQQHVEKYGMSKDELHGSKSIKGLYQQSFEAVEKSLIISSNFTKEQALTVWDDYCQKRKIFNQKKITGRVAVEDAYDIRGYEKLVQNCAAQREQALLQAVTDDYCKNEQIYQLDAQTVGYLMSQGLQPIDFQELTGNALQHQLQSELCSIVQQAAIAARYISYDSNMLKDVVLCADAGVASNKAELMDMAFAMTDMSHGLMGFVLAVSKESNRLLGVAAQQAVESIIHLPETTVHGVVTMYRFLEFVKDQVCHDYDQDYFEQKSVGLQDRAEIVIAGLQTISEVVCDWATQKTMQQKSEDIIKFVTDFGVNIVATEAAISKIASAVRVFATNLKRAAELAQKKSMLQPALEVGVDLENFAHAKVTEKVTQKIDEVLVSKAGELEVMLVNRMDAEIATSGSLPVAAVSKTTMPLKDVVKKLITEGAPHSDRLFQQEALQHFNQLFSKDELFKFSEKAKELYGQGIIVNKGEKMQMVCDVEHIMTYNLKFKKNYRTGLVEGFISGGHVGLYSKKIEAAGHIIIKAEQALLCGARAIEYEHLFGNNIAKKTEYPLSWSGEQIMQANIEAFENQIYCEDFLRGGVKHMQIVGISKEGLKIEMFVTKIGDNKLALDTAYPYFEQYSKIKGL